MLACETELLKDGQVFHGSIAKAMGTRLEMVAIGGEAEIRPLWDWMRVELSHLDAKLNRFSPESEVSRLNACGADEYSAVSETLEGCTSLSMRYWRLTEGLFDVTKGGMADVVLEDGKLCLKGHKIDFGGLAKGFFLRLLKERFRNIHSECAFVDFGGSSILTVGHHPHGDCWKVGVRNPYSGTVLSEVRLLDSSMSTSGNSPGYSGHVLNPLTGEKCLSRRLVTVVGPDPLDAEVLSTALMLADEGQASRILSRFPEAEAIVRNL